MHARVRELVKRGAWIACVLGMAAGAVLHAQPGGGLSLSWDAPAGCPDERAVEARVLELAAPASTVSPLAAQATVRQVAPHRYRLQLRVRGADGQGARQLYAESCQAAAEAAALVLALAMDARRAPPAPAPPDPASTPGRERESARAPTEGARPVQLAAWAAGELGALPRLSPGLGASASLHWSRFGLRARGEYFFATEEAGPAADARARFELWSVGAQACYYPWVGTVRAGACAGQDVGAMTGRPEGVAVPRSNSGLWLASSLDVELLWYIWRTGGLRTSLGTRVAWRRPRFELDDVAEPLYDPPLLSWRGTAGLFFSL